MTNSRTYLRVVRFARPYWKHISVSIVCTIFYSLTSGASISLFMPLLDILFRPAEPGHAPLAPTLPQAELPSWLSGLFGGLKDAVQIFVFSGSQMDVLYRICVMIVAAFLLKNFFGYMQSYLMNYAEEGVIKDLRNALYRHLHDLPLAYFTNERTGELI